MVSQSVKKNKDKKVEASKRTKMTTNYRFRIRSKRKKSSSEVTLRLYITTQWDWEMLKNQFPAEVRITRIASPDAVTETTKLFWRDTEGVKFVVDVNGWKPVEDLYDKWRKDILGGTFFSPPGEAERDRELTIVENTLCSPSSAFKYRVGANGAGTWITPNILTLGAEKMGTLDPQINKTFLVLFIETKR
jgi:hypothetical protein